jgi:uncharacterized membrane protein
MNVILAGTIFAVAMSAGILVLLEIGRRIGVRQLAEEGETASQASVRSRVRSFSIAFAVALSVTAYVIIDLEYPRLGFIQVSDSDQVLVDLRRNMN